MTLLATRLRDSSSTAALVEVEPESIPRTYIFSPGFLLTGAAALAMPRAALSVSANASTRVRIWPLDCAVASVSIFKTGMSKREWINAYSYE